MNLLAEFAYLVISIGLLLSGEAGIAITAFKLLGTALTMISKAPTKS